MVDINEKIYEFVYSEALNDAIQQKAYEGKKAWIKEVEKPKECLKKYINNIICGKFNSQKEHDEVFTDTAKCICDEINKIGEIKNSEYPDEFTFGNAQKLINIAIKHFYIIYYCNNEIRENFRWCHCPVDQSMLEKVWCCK